MPGINSILWKLCSNETMLCYVFVETYNTLMKVVVVSSEQEMSRTDLALGLIRDMIAAGLGENFGALPSDVYCYESSLAPIYFYSCGSFLTNFFYNKAGSQAGICSLETMAH